MGKITINDLLEAGCHFGHQTKRWNPRMKDYVFGAKNGISIIDLTKTMRQIADACNFLQRIVSTGGDILFVGTKRQAQQIIQEAAEKTGMYSVTERWMGGALTNNVTIRKSINRMREIDRMFENGEINALKKKEQAVINRKRVRLHRDLDGIADMKRVPAALVVVDVCHDAIAIREANKLNIPTVAIVDTNGDPSTIDYPVAANDDAVKSIKIIMDLFTDSIKTAAEVYHKKMVEEKNKVGAEEKIAGEEADDKDRKGQRKPTRRPAARKAAKGDEAVAEAAAEVAAEAVMTEAVETVEVSDKDADKDADVTTVDTLAAVVPAKIVEAIVGDLEEEKKVIKKAAKKPVRKAKGDDAKSEDAE